MQSKAFYSLPNQHIYIDFHTHSMWNGDDTIEVVSVHGHQQKQCHYYTLGFHPWWTLAPLEPSELSLLLNKYQHDERCIGLGEFGLDNHKGPALDIQEKILIQQLNIANQVAAPVVIHCVRAFDRLLRLRKSQGNSVWAIHGFVRNKILASQVLDAGMYISVAPADKMTPVFIEMLKYVPLDKVFLETDSDFSMNIKDRYAIFASLKNLKVEALQEIIFQNFSTFYKNKWKYHLG